MDYQQFKVIEEYFRLGELIRKNNEKLFALTKFKEGVVSLNNLSVIQQELKELGLTGIDYLNIDELYSELIEEIIELSNRRKELKENSFNFNINLDKLILEKELYEYELNNA